MKNQNNNNNNNKILDYEEDDDMSITGEFIAFRCERPDLAPNIVIEENNNEDIEERF